MATSLTPPGRLLSLDVFRGLTIAGMIIVNDPGSWRYVYPPLRHASWHGITPTDLVFPFFLFIVGVSITFAYRKRLEKNPARKPLIGKIFRRTAILFGLGLFLALFPKFNFGNLRVVGVLQRIALVFMACSFLFLYTNWKQQIQWGAWLLLGYWFLMAVVPVPIDATVQQALDTGQVLAQGGMLDIGPIRAISDQFIAANFEPGANLQAWVDRYFLPGRLYQKTWDPEGLLSTLPSIGTGILGMLTGHLLISKQETTQKVLWVMMAGFLALLVGHIWSWFFPFNKNLWSSSFVMYTGGLATLCLGASYWFVDVLGRKRSPLIYIGQVFGANAITAYVLHGMLFRLFVLKFGEGDAAWSLNTAFMNGLMGLGLAPELVSFLYALTYTAICFVPIWIMYQRKIFVKV
ncbi:MAG: heparan-alpha-glucosaminide N-acetyltransferase domain-containing protein [Bacteroidota bacterium]